MSTGAIIFMVVGCTLLWGGFIVSVVINFRHSARDKENFNSQDDVDDL